jgi:ElaB/YqjD/DUF883 family membrane-anchored ribosome-binding protein
MSQNWSKLYSQTKGLKEAQHIQAVLNPEEINKLLSLLVEVWQEFASHNNSGKGLKAYIDQELRNDAAQNLVENPPSNSETLEQWTKRIFKDQKFGAVINELEAYSNSLSKLLASIIQPLLQDAGMPALGVSWLSFMGNYGYTPFGVHRESEGEDGFLFHLGPETKTFYIWKIEDYNRITGGSEVSPLNDELLAVGEGFELEPGDVFFIPYDTYHIAYTGEFSASIVMDFINPPVSRFIVELDTNFMKSDPKQTYLEPLKEDVSEAFNHISDQIKQDYVLKEKIYHKLRKIQSNAGVGKASVQKSVQDFDLTKKYVLVKPFKMILIQDDEKESGRIYARGHSQSYSELGNLEQVFKLWNEGSALSLEEVKEIMIPSWPEMDVMGLFMYLFIIESIESVA